MKRIQEKQLDNIIESKLIHKGFRLKKSGKHKKGKLCSGLLFLLFITLGLSLSVSSEDTNALKFDVNTIPLYYPSIAVNAPNFYNQDYGFSITYSDSSYSLSNVSHDLVYTLRTVDSQCQGVAYKELPWVINRSNGETFLSYGFSGFSFVPSWIQNSSSDQWADVPCLSVNPINNIDVGSVSQLAGIDVPLRTRLTNLPPYRFEYDSFYTHDITRQEGFDFQTKFSLADVFKSTDFPNNISHIQIPLGPTSSSALSEFTNNTPISISGEFLIDPLDFNYDFLSNTTIGISSNVLYSSGNGGSISPTHICSSNLLHKESDEPGIYSLEYNCSYNLDSSSDYDTRYSYPFFFLYVDITYNDLSHDNRFNDFYFDSQFVVTNNDTTNGGSFNSDPQGSDVRNAPGSADQNIFDTDVSQDGINFTQTLTKLFSFSMLNPFAPLFNLFSDQNSCANIPTLAGMLHSESSQVCPWFDSTTRNIVTPILGLSAMMLIFGFVVRWLGSGSGNMFIDDDIKDTGGGFSLRNKFRRKG